MAGIYVIRTDVPTEQLSAGEVVSAYKCLSRVEDAWVEDAFRSLKCVDIAIRPIYHRLEERVQAHAFLCLLAEYLVFQLRTAWASLTFADEEKNEPRVDAVVRAKRGEAAKEKARTRQTAEGAACHSFPTLLAHWATPTRNAIFLPVQAAALQVVRNQLRIILIFPCRWAHFV